MKRYTLASLMILALLLAAVPAQPATAAAVLIDHFESLQEVSDPAGINPTNNTLLDATVLGGERDMRTVRTAGAQAVIANSNLTPSRLSHSQGSGTRGYTQIVWDGIDGDALAIAYTGLGGVDLTTAGGGGIYIWVVSDDWPCSLVIRVYTDATNFSTYTLTLPGLVSNTGYYIDFTDVGWVDNGAGADFTNAGAVELVIDGQGQDDVDVTIDWIRTTAPTAVELENLGATPDAALFRWQIVGLLLPVAGVMGLAGLWISRRKQETE